MKKIIQRRIQVVGLAVVLAVAAVSGCQITPVSLEGTTATQKENVALKQGGPHQERWEDSSIIVQFSFNSQPDGFAFNGSVELAPRLEKTYRTVTNFSVRANFLDEEKTILKSIVIVMASNQPIRQWGFAQRFDLPPEARFINFSYSGRAMEGGTLGPGGDGTDTFFWKVP